MKLAVSVTHSVGVGGMGVSAAYRSAVEARARATGRLRCRSKLKLHHGGRFAPGLCLEVRLGCEFIAEKAGDQHSGKTAPAGIESLSRLIESLSLNRNPVLSALE